MRVVVFTSETDGALARIEVPSAPGPKRKSPVEWLPVAIHAATAEAAAEKAEAFYRGELERFAKRDAAKARAVEALANHRAAKATEGASV